MRLFKRTILVVALVVGAGGLGPGAGSATDFGSCLDATPPVLKDLSLDQTRVNVEQASRSILISARVTAEGNEATSVFVGATPPGHSGIRMGRELNLTAGTASQGTWTGKLRIPRFSVKGQWTLEVDVSDQVRSQNHSTEDLTAAGFPGSFRVRSNPDDAAPQLKDLSFTPSILDTSSGGQYVRITSTVKEIGSPVRFFEVRFGRDVWGTGSYGVSTELRRKNGTSRFVGNLFVPARADHDVAATWRLSVVLVDHVVNIRQLGPLDLQNLGLPSELGIVNKGDPNPPQLTSLTFTPDTVDGQTRPVITVKAGAAARGSGSAYGVLTLDGPSDSELPSYRVPVVSTSGKESFLKAHLWLGCDAPSGTYSVVSFSVSDQVGNIRTYWSSELADIGVTTSFTVTG
ncbi:MAG TPA: hypothetical protein VFX15_07550 [Actinomycetes bacterium]|nr:hypothetical protein [Actinomycetes bacterium]